MAASTASFSLSELRCSLEHPSEALTESGAEELSQKEAAMESLSKEVSFYKQGGIKWETKLRDLSYQRKWKESYKVCDRRPEDHNGPGLILCVWVCVFQFLAFVGVSLRVRFVPKVSSCRLDSWRACFAAPWFGQATWINYQAWYRGISLLHSLSFGQGVDGEFSFGSRDIGYLPFLPAEECWISDGSIARWKPRFLDEREVQL